MSKKDIGKNIELLNIIGKGSYGNVYLGRDNLTREYYAIKVISKTQLKSRIVYQYFNNEIYILKHLDHPNIVKYINLIEKKDDYWLIIEYCNGESFAKALKYYVKKYNRPLPEKIVRYFILNVLKAVIYLNHQNIIHRDIKSDNILLNYENENDLILNNFINAKVKLIDFGFARYLDNNELAGSLVGTPMYMDPNVLKTFLESKTRVVQGFYDQKVDVWSLGILTYELLIGIVPFISKDIKGLFQNVNERDFYIPKEEKRNFELSESAINFIDKTLNIDSNLRPLPAELINDPWFSDNYENDTLYQMKTDDEIKYLKNKKYFINFWKPKETSSSQKSFDSSKDNQPMKKKEHYTSLKTVNYDPKKRNRMRNKFANKNMHFATMINYNDHDYEDEMDDEKKEDNTYTREKTSTYYGGQGFGRKKHDKKHLKNITSDLVLNNTEQNRFYTENERRDSGKETFYYTSYSKDNKNDKLFKKNKMQHNINANAKKKTIKIKSINYVSPGKEEQEKKFKPDELDIYYKHISPIKKKNFRLNFKPKILSNTFICRQKNLDSDSAKRQKIHFSHFSKSNYNNYKDSDDESYN